MNAGTRWFYFVRHGCIVRHSSINRVHYRSNITSGIERKLGRFRDTEDDVIESDDSDMLWVDDADEGALDSMEQL